MVNINCGSTETILQKLYNFSNEILFLYRYSLTLEVRIYFTFFLRNGLSCPKVLLRLLYYPGVCCQVLLMYPNNRFESITLQNFPIVLFGFPQFLPIMLVFMLFSAMHYAVILCFSSCMQRNALYGKI